MTASSAVEAPVAVLRVDGGAAASDLLLQFQADILGVAVERSAITETTALGAAYLAGLGVGLWKSPDDLASHRAVDRTFAPTMPPAEREAPRRPVFKVRRYRADTTEDQEVVLWELPCL